MTSSNDRRDASDALDRAWDALLINQPNTAGDERREHDQAVAALIAMDDAPAPEAIFAENLREQLLGGPVNHDAPGHEDRRAVVHLAASPFGLARGLPTWLATAGVAAVIALVLATAGPWLSNEARAPIVASALASSTPATDSPTPATTTTPPREAKYALADVTLLVLPEATPVAGNLQRGDRVTVLDARHLGDITWLRVRAESGETGWLQADKTSQSDPRP